MSNLQSLKRLSPNDFRLDLLAMVIDDESGRPEQAEQALDRYERACGHKSSPAEVAAELKRLFDPLDLALCLGD